MEKSEESYTCREIDLLINPVLNKLEEIHEQCKKTNGRVNKLEKWQAFIKGGLTILTLMVVPIMIALIIQWIKL